MTPNDLKKGDFVMLRNGWKARIEDNRKGTTRICTVWGFETEMGSVYAHDMVYKLAKPDDINSEIVPLVLTPSMVKCRNLNERFFGRAA